MPDTDKHEKHRSILAGIGEWWREYAANREMEAELRQLGPEEVERMAHDVGLSAAELHEIAARGVHASDEAPEMMAALGLDPKDLEAHDPGVFHDILRVCSQCEAKGRCHHDLHDGAAAEHFTEYCANAATLKALRAVHAAAKGTL